MPCSPPDVARMAVAAPGITISTMASLSPAPLATVDDSSSGTLVFFRSNAALPPNAATLFSSLTMVPTDPSLQSCDYLLSDRPAAKPFIQAAIAAAVTRNLGTSVSTLRSSLSAIEIGDNPITSDSLLVVLLVTGPPQATVAGHTVYGPDTSIFVILNRNTMAITGVGHGSW